MKKILVFKKGNVAIVSGKRSVNKTANLATSTTITIDKEEPVSQEPATNENIRKYFRGDGRVRRPLDVGQGRSSSKKD